ncbi:MAG: prephenate dehydrogenase/arogenate dehydrogenase family protein [Lachnospiraceae bacterium]
MSHFGFIGFGLIGGSIARALKALPAPPVLTAYQYRSTPSRSLTLALEEKTLDYITNDLSELSSCDMIFLCAPVQKNLEYLPMLKDVISPTCILTDVGSVKGQIHQRITELHMEDCFIGGHPMTGSEKTGYEHSSALLMENAYYILTPTSKTTEEAIKRYSTLVEQMGSIPVILDPAEHDRITAAISHVPHLIAAQLVNLIRTSGPLESKMRLLAAGGFKDITRIASSSPELWENICLENKESVCEVLRQYQSLLSDALTAVEQENSDALYRLFDDAGTYRSSIPARTSGILATVYELFVDIKDETGALASLAALLSSHSISIKNIGILHNREFEQGVLRVEFYSEECRQQAIRILTQNGYYIYVR